MENRKKRLTIGVLVSGIMDEFTRCVCKGVFQAARLADVNVVVFPGKYIERDMSEQRELMYEYQYNTVFSYAGKGNIDALIVAAGSIGCFASEKSIEEMMKRYEKIPSVLVASKLKGYVSAVFDNYQGIKEGMEYLIEKAGCRKFGMIGGNSENTDAQERKQAFVEVLTSHGIEFEEKMYVEGDFSRRCTAACRKLLDENPGIEAVFCVNDATAMGLYEELRCRGLKPGKDISVLGYDDTIMAAKVAPSLSSVRADAGKLGEEAVKIVLGMLKGEQVKDHVVSTRFIKRDSFRQTEEDEIKVIEKRELDTGFEDIFYRYCHEEMQEQMNKLWVSYKKLMIILSANCEGSGIKQAGYADIMACVDEFLSFGGVEYADTDKLLSDFEKIYKTLRDKQPDDKSRFELRDIFSAIYRKIIQAMNHQFGSMKESKDIEDFSMKLFVQDMLQFEKGRDQSYSSLLENLDWLKIKNACIYMQAKPSLHLFREKFEVPEELYLKAVLHQGKVCTVPANRQKKNLGEIYNNPMIESQERYERVVLPLFFKEMVYGILFCDMTERIYTNGEFLVNQISSAIKMIALLQANEEIQQQLEENLVALRAHNIELDTISKSDVLTGILNRRGFYNEAEKRIRRSHQKGRNVLIIYADMNNLKIINDRYGHEEGDYSLKLIGSFLEAIVKDKGIAGRIGGDEYACVIEYDKSDGGEEVLNNLYRRFEEFNAKSDKPYNVMVSAGACVWGREETMTLQEALTQADEKLYEVKQYRKKDVAKQI